MARKQKTSQPLTTAQKLSSLVKSARDIMRKDKGLNGDLDRLPMLTWIMFLKFLDDMEQIREQEAAMRGEGETTCGRTDTTCVDTAFLSPSPQCGRWEQTLLFSGRTTTTDSFNLY